MPTTCPTRGLSLTHGNALVVTLLPALTGAVDHSVFSRRFTKTRLWDVCIEYGCTTWSNLGGIASAIYGELPSAKDRMHKVRAVVSAGMLRQLWVAFEERFGVRVLEWYGTMEGGAFAYKPPGAGPVGSFGKPPDVLELAIVDDNEQPVPPGVVGELVGRPVAGPAQLEYFKNAVASAHKTRGCWMHTGDMCWRDADGWYYFAHRKEEGGIRRMGEFISEGFVRRTVLEHPDVLDAHVYGVPSRTGAPGESDVVVAVIVRERHSFDAASLFERPRSSDPTCRTTSSSWTSCRRPLRKRCRLASSQLCSMRPIRASSSGPAPQSDRGFRGCVAEICGPPGTSARQPARSPAGR